MVQDSGDPGVAGGRPAAHAREKKWRAAGELSVSLCGDPTGLNGDQLYHGVALMLHLGCYRGPVANLKGSSAVHTFMGNLPGIQCERLIFFFFHIANV